MSIASKPNIKQKFVRSFDYSESYKPGKYVAFSVPVNSGDKTFVFTYLKVGETRFDNFQLSSGQSVIYSACDCLQYSMVYLFKFLRLHDKLFVCIDWNDRNDETPYEVYPTAIHPNVFNLSLNNFMQKKRAIVISMYEPDNLTVYKYKFPLHYYSDFVHRFNALDKKHSTQSSN